MKEWNTEEQIEAARGAAVLLNVLTDNYDRSNTRHDYLTKDEAESLERLLDLVLAVLPISVLRDKKAALYAFGTREEKEQGE